MLHGMPADGIGGNALGLPMPNTDRMICMAPQKHKGNAKWRAHGWELGTTRQLHRPSFKDHTEWDDCSDGCQTTSRTTLTSCLLLNAAMTTASPQGLL